MQIWYPASLPLILIGAGLAAALPCQTAGNSQPRNPERHGGSCQRRISERGIMLLEKLILDEEYYRTSQYGVLGEDYEISEDGYYVAVGEPSSAGFQVKRATSGPQETKISCSIPRQLQRC